MSEVQINIVIGALVIAWIGQIFGAWMQWKNFHSVVSDVQRRWNDGHMGVGRFRKKFGFGCVSVLVVGADQTVKEMQILKGVSVFAKFKRILFAEGMQVDQLVNQLDKSGLHSKEQLAILDAVKKIEEVSKKQ